MMPQYCFSFTVDLQGPPKRTHFLKPCSPKPTAVGLGLLLGNNPCSLTLAAVSCMLDLKGFVILACRLSETHFHLLIPPPTYTLFLLFPLLSFSLKGGKLSQERSVACLSPHSSLPQGDFTYSHSFSYHLSAPDSSLEVLQAQTHIFQLCMKHLLPNFPRIFQKAAHPKLCKIFPSLPDPSFFFLD